MNVYITHYNLLFYSELLKNIQVLGFDSIAFSHVQHQSNRL